MAKSVQLVGTWQTRTVDEGAIERSFHHQAGKWITVIDLKSAAVSIDNTLTLCSFFTVSIFLPWLINTKTWYDEH